MITVKEIVIIDMLNQNPVAAHVQMRPVHCTVQLQMRHFGTFPGSLLPASSGHSLEILLAKAWILTLLLNTADWI